MLLKNPRFSKIYKNMALDFQRLADGQNDEKGVFQQNQHLTFPNGAAFTNVKC
jgi:hypothetical protein